MSPSAIAEALAALGPGAQSFEGRGGDGIRQLLAVALGMVPPAPQSLLRVRYVGDPGEMPTLARHLLVAASAWWGKPAYAGHMRELIALAVTTYAEPSLCPSCGGRGVAWTMEGTANTTKPCHQCHGRCHVEPDALTLAERMGADDAMWQHLHAKPYNGLRGTLRGWDAEGLRRVAEVLG